ncbi:hypothetical protein LPJ61_003491 [Coemansia biformis]|uniref:HMG box domain-containing protein n=1 Tax=Coemansia biformis TaxID=1286918 RepID=A0A9W7YCG5_9FUNG|nr:hypothetical protein LPJ61_003491 [Coemansia biformis]
MDAMGTIEEAFLKGVDLAKTFEQELGKLAIIPGLVSAPVSSAPAGVLLNRVPPGYTAVLINLEECSRSELRSFLHNRLCEPQGENSCGGGEPPKRPSLNHCKCQMIEFDYQPDFVFGKCKHDGSECDDDEYSEVEMAYDEGYVDYDCTADNQCLSNENADASRSRSNSDADADNNSDANGSDSERGSGDDTSKAAKVPGGKKIEIKRPPNSFMIFRSERHNDAVKIHRGGNRVVSRILGDMWHDLPAEEKIRYREMAAAKKLEHKMMYPNYKFTPRRRRA